MHKWKIKVIAFLMLHLELTNSVTLILLMICFVLVIEQLKNRIRKLGDSHSRQLLRDVNVERIISISDLACIEDTRMDKHAFHVLCAMLRGVGKLEPTRNMGVEEMVAMFLHILAQDVKIRVIKKTICEIGRNN